MTGISSAIQNSAAASVWQPPVQQPTSLLGQLKGLFVTPDSDGTHVDAARHSFEQYFQRETSALADMMGPKGIEGFARDVQARFESIVQRTFDALPRREDGSVGGKDFASAMKSAGKEAAMALDRLKVDAARAELLSNLGPVDTRPQIIARGDKFVVIRPAPQLENMVLRGGGAKGIGYSAGLDQMEKAGMLAGVRHLAGSSAGALTATCLAAGLSAAQFEQGPADALFRPGVLDALKGGADLARIYPDLRMEGGLAPAVASLKVVDQATMQSVQGYLSAHWNTAAFQDKLVALAGQGQLDARHLERLTTLQQLPDFEQAHPDSMITFGDLKLLNQLAPETFKQLTLTGWNKTDQREEYFSADTTPDMPVAYAARISMAFPIAFKAVSLETPDAGRKVYADGGIGSNMPSEVFTHPADAHGVRTELTGQAREQAQARTLLLTFDQNGKAYQVMHGGPPQRPAPGVLGKIKAFFVNLITRHPDQAATGLADRHKIRDAGPNALPVFHGGISTLTSNISDQTQHQAHMLSAWKALEQIDARTQQAYSMECDSLEELAGLLTEDEKRALRDGPAPDGPQRQLLAILDGPPAPGSDPLLLRV
ncbi:MAG: patatin-like phospholipase family protein [Achromobacter sp.]|uniref:patatin-like phospholipase family protein n=1 Tax=Achromobacter sp. TaxID=134375 RepID=UPI003CFF38FF